MGQEFEPVNEKYSKQLLVKLFQVLSTGGVGILAEHLELSYYLRRFPGTSLDGFAEAQDKLSLSISGPGHNKNVRILDITAAYVNREGKWGRTPLHLSAETGDSELVNIFLRAGANVNAEYEYKQTPLHLSAKHGHTKVTKILLKAGANVDAEGMYKQTPLHLSARHGYTEVVENLLKAGANVNAEGMCKQTPLHFSAENGHTEVTKILLKAGANVNAAAEYKETPLHLSVVNGHKEVVKALLKAGANVNAESTFKQTPLHYSATQGHKEVVETLLKAGANINAEGMCKQTALQISIEYKQGGVTGLLLHAAASVKDGDICGGTNLDYTVDRQRVRFRHTSLDRMHDRQKVRDGIKTRTLFKLSNWNYSLTNSKKHVQRSTSSKTKTEHTETISATFTAADSETYEEGSTSCCRDHKTNPIEINRKNSDQDYTSSESPTLLTDGPLLKKSAGTSSSLKSLCNPSSPAESHDLDDEDLQELSNIRQQVENHLSKLSLETTVGCKTRCSHDVKAAFQAGRIVIPTTINITQHKNVTNIENVKHYYEPGTNLNINHAENVAPGGQIVHNHTRQATTVEDDEDNNSSDNDSFYSI